MLEATVTGLSRKPSRKNARKQPNYYLTRNGGLHAPGDIQETKDSDYEPHNSDRSREGSTIPSADGDTGCNEEDFLPGPYSVQEETGDEEDDALNEDLDKDEDFSEDLDKDEDLNEDPHKDYEVVVQPEEYEFRSSVWKFFSVTPIDGSSFTQGKKLKLNYQLKCLSCHHKTTLKRIGGKSSNLKRHLKRVHPLSYIRLESDEALEIKVMEGKVKDSIKDSIRGSQRAQKHTRTFTNLVNMIVRENLPFSFIESDGLREFLSAENINVIGNRRNVVNHIHSEVFTVKSKIMEELKFADRVSLITDCWEAPCHDWYMGTIVHFVDNRTFQEKIYLIGFDEIVGDHSGNSLARMLFNLIEAFNITTKLVCVVCDAASNNIKAMESLSSMIESSVKSKITKAIDKKGIFANASQETQENDAIEKLVKQICNFCGDEQCVRCTSHIIHNVALVVIKHTSMDYFETVKRVSNNNLHYHTDVVEDETRITTDDKGVHEIDDLWQGGSDIEDEQDDADVESSAAFANVSFIEFYKAAHLGELFEDVDSSRETNATLRELQQLIDELENKEVHNYFHDDAVGRDDIVNISNTLDKLRTLLKKIKLTHILRKRFKESCIKKGLRPKIIGLDVRTRWNSTWEMVNEVLKYKEVIEEFCEVYINPEDFGKCTGDDSESLSLAKRDWRLLLHLATILRPFNRLTSVSSSERPVNRLNKCLIVLFALNEMLETLKEEAEKDNGMGHYSKAAKYGLRLLKKYLDIADRSDLILSAHLLDPNNRATILKQNYSQKDFDTIFLSIKKSVTKHVLNHQRLKYYNAEGNDYPNLVNSLIESEPSSPESFTASKRHRTSVGSLGVNSKELSAFDKWSLKVLTTAQIDLNSNEDQILRRKKRGFDEERITAQIEEEWGRFFSVNGSGQYHNDPLTF